MIYFVPNYLQNNTKFIQEDPINFSMKLNSLHYKKKVGIMKKKRHVKIWDSFILKSWVKTPKKTQNMSGGGEGRSWWQQVGTFKLGTRCFIHGTGFCS